MEPTKEPEPVDPARAGREALWASVGVLLVLAAIKHTAAYVPIVRQHGFTLALAFQLFVPLWLLDRNGVTMASLGLTWRTWRRDLKWLVIAAAVTVVVYAPGLHVYMTYNQARSFTFRWPPGLGETVLVNVLLVGLVEELFFRGYLQERWGHVWTKRWPVLGAPVGLALVVSAAVFALAHFVGEYSPARLGPFFPGLVFGWLRAKTGTIVAAAGYHGFCNVLADVLIYGYRP